MGNLNSISGILYSFPVWKQQQSPVRQAPPSEMAQTQPTSPLKKIVVSRTLGPRVGPQGALWGQSQFLHRFLQDVGLQRGWQHQGILTGQHKI